MTSIQLALENRFVLLVPSELCSLGYENFTWCMCFQWQLNKIVPLTCTCKTEICHILQTASLTVWIPIHLVWSPCMNMYHYQGLLHYLLSRELGPCNNICILNSVSTNLHWPCMAICNQIFLHCIILHDDVLLCCTVNHVWANELQRTCPRGLVIFRKGVSFFLNKFLSKCNYI